ncbi:histidine phosphatase family protein [Marinigracilibium pacificum]|uniref:Histidine phosphatase family protein n=1 Tax=Marinigracilibium pacificum TaxID=2729599 RepID=A0A848J100_9BACT|nr:histidine phosphatase family protein [Marinigracilibium pacificum]NMM47969.1 histidine phosphatase family protein [Marinigracilibium pacificum]
MSTKTIYLIRHGETDYNRKGIVQGSGINAPLNEQGRAQAEAFFSSYKDEGFEKVYTSDLIRTIESVAGFIDLGIEHEIVPELKEINWGEKEGKKVSLEDKSDYSDLIAEWYKGNTHLAFKGGESPNEVRDRMAIGFDRIIQQDFSKILVCIHGRAMRILLSHLLNYPLKYMDVFKHGNLQLYKLLYDDGNYILVKSNDYEHLKD